MWPCFAFVLHVDQGLWSYLFRLSLTYTLWETLTESLWSSPGQPSTLYLGFLVLGLELWRRNDETSPTHLSEFSFLVFKSALVLAILKCQIVLRPAVLLH